MPALQEGESWVLTSRSGAERLSAWRRAGKAGVPPAEAVLCASPPGEPANLDLAAVPRLLRERLDVRIAGIQVQTSRYRLTRRGPVAVAPVVLAHYEEKK